ncbi:hypothetical protein [Candidatus Thiosymbion oneisti]|uniref:hypothetical protein n=1 Tax=Candidatus Thiosymbion oneisti TaxID=589554 RepID=UPI00105E9943|nr:hypothetical protein [Candidatus Thiosymbion oneisti]
MNIEQLYQQYINPIPATEQLELISLISKKLIVKSEQDRKQRRLVELEGLGSKIWEGVNAQKYVDELRDEWNHRL